jgi:hypothetical protein
MTYRFRGCRFALLGALAASVGCGDDENDDFTADVSGDYTVALTNADNGCAFEQWERGDTTTGIGLSIEQQGRKLDASVDGVSSFVLGLVLGTAEFEGEARGLSFTMTAYGTIPRREGNCSFTINAEVEGELDGDSISGTITYAPATNDNPDCAEVRCSSVQNFSGSRPPPP